MQHGPKATESPAAECAVIIADGKRTHYKFKHRTRWASTWQADRSRGVPLLLTQVQELEQTVSNFSGDQVLLDTQL